jgi:hypothetical protein
MLDVLLILAGRTKEKSVVQGVFPFFVDAKESDIYPPFSATTVTIERMVNAGVKSRSSQWR